MYEATNDGMFGMRALAAGPSKTSTALFRCTVSAAGRLRCCVSFPHGRQTLAHERLQHHACKGRGSVHLQYVEVALVLERGTDPATLHLPTS